MLLYLAFYKAPGTWVNRLIRVVTRSPYSHVELVFPGEGCFSADSRELKAVRFKTMPLPAEKWDVVEIPCTDAQANAAMEFCLEERNAPYDWLGVARFVLPFFRQHPQAWFCSEVCAAALQCAGLLPAGLKSWKLSPADLYREVKRIAA